MHHILVYKNNVSLKSNFEGQGLSTNEKHAMHFCTNEDHIFTQIINDQADVLFYLTEELNQNDILTIKSALKLNNSLYVALFSKDIFALDAWHLNAYHFDTFPMEMFKMKRAFARYLHYKNPSRGQVLSLKLSDGTHKIPFNQIKYLHASGNYTFIHYGKDAHFLLTKQLGQFDFLPERDPSFQRVHRSLIINTSNIKSVIGKDIHFLVGKKTLQVSQSLSNKIKTIAMN